MSALASSRGAAAIAAACLCLASASPAFSHASLLQSDPADGSVLSEAPQRWTLRFNEPVSPIVLRAIDDKGDAVTLGGARENGPEISVGLPVLAKGAHALSWRVMSSDGHPVGGTIVVSVGALGAALAQAQGGMPASLGFAIWLDRLAIYAGLFAGVGGVFFHTWTGPSARAKRFVDLSLLAGIVAIAAAPALQGADMLGEALPVSPQTWLAGAASPYGVSVGFAALAIMLAGLTRYVAAANAQRMLASTALCGVALALASSGHASSAPPQWLTRPVAALHAASVAFWLGALVPLAILMRDNHPAAAAALQRFSRVIPFPLIALVVSGAILAIVQIQTPSSLWTTAYGRILIGKLALVAALFALAAVNRWKLTPDFFRGDKAAVGRMARTIFFEGLLALLALGLVAGWRFTPPPRALFAADAATSAHVHIHGEKAMADVTITPGRAGAVSVSIGLLNGQFGALDAREVAVSLSNPKAGIEPIRVPARRVDDGNWRVDRLVAPAPGLWHMKIAILVDEFSEIGLEDDVTLRP